jgi:hypothetical protein
LGFDFAEQMKRPFSNKTAREVGWGWDLRRAGGFDRVYGPVRFELDWALCPAFNGGMN